MCGDFQDAHANKKHVILRAEDRYSRISIYIRILVNKFSVCSTLYNSSKLTQSIWCIEKWVSLRMYVWNTIYLSYKKLFTFKVFLQFFLYLSYKKLFTLLPKFIFLCPLIPFSFTLKQKALQSFIFCSLILALCLGLKNLNTWNLFTNVFRISLVDPTSNKSV